MKNINVYFLDFGLYIYYFYETIVNHNNLTVLIFARQDGQCSAN